MSVKEKLLDQERQLEEQLSVYKREDPLLTGEKDQAYSLEDSISQTEGHDRISATRQGLKLRLSEVKRALEKIDDGSYGVCDNCGQKIFPERLEFLPSAVYCIDCENK